MSLEEFCDAPGKGPQCTDSKWERAETEQHDCLLRARAECMAQIDNCISRELADWEHTCRDNPFGNGMQFEQSCMAEWDCAKTFAECYCLGGGLRCTSCSSYPTLHECEDQGGGDNITLTHITLGNVGITGSAYDVPIPIIKGRSIVSGNVIWVGNRRTETVSQTTLINERYETELTDYGFLDIAIGLSEGMLESVSRMWVDGRLVINDVVPVTDDRAVPRNRRFYDTGFDPILYRGSEAQTPDTVMSSEEGAELTPGHRGMCYIMLRNFPILAKGLSIPQVRIELLEEVDPDGVLQEEYDPGYAPDADMLMVDPEAALVYLSDGADIRAVDIGLLEEKFTIPVTGSPMVEAGSFLTAEGTLVLRRADDTLSAIFPGNADDVITSSATLDSGGTGAAIRVFDLDAADSFQVLGIAVGAKVYLFSLSTDSIDLLHTHAGQTSGTFARILATTEQSDSLSARRGLVALSQEGGNLALVKKTLTDFENAIDFDPTVAPVKTLVPSTSFGGSGAFTLHDAFYNPIDESLIVFVTESGTKRIVKIMFSDDSVEWYTTVAEFPNFGASRKLRLETTPEYAYISGQNVYVVDLDGGSVTATAVPGSPAQDGPVFYDSVLRQIIYRNTDDTITKHYVERVVPKRVTAGAIAKRIMESAYIPFDQINVSSALADDVAGFYIDNPQAAATYLVALHAYFGMTVLESGGKMTARMRSDAVAFDIEADDLWVDVRQSYGFADKEIEGVQFSYYDIARDGAIDSQNLNRDIMDADDDFVADSNIAQVSVPVWATVTEARLAAERLVWWSAQRAHETMIILAPYYLALEPGDFVKLAEDTITKRRAYEVDLDTTMKIGIKAKNDDSDIYDSQPPLVGVQRTGMESGIVDSIPNFQNFPIILNLAPINTPNTRQGANTEERVYIGQMNPTGDDFVATEMWLRGDFASYYAIGTPTREPMIGRLVTPPNDTTTPFTTDYESTVVIEFNKDLPADIITQIEALSDVTELYESDYLNSMWIGREIIQWVHGSVDPDNRTVTLTTLFRGRWGTDRYTDSHAVGELVVLHNEDALLEAIIPASVASAGGPITAALIDRDHPETVKSTSAFFNPRTSVVWKPTNVRRRDVQYLGDLFTCGIYVQHATRTPYINTFEDDILDYVPNRTTTTLYLLNAAYDPTTFATERAAGGYPTNDDKTVSTNTYIIRLFNEEWFSSGGDWSQYYQDEMEADGTEFGAYLTAVFVTQSRDIDDEVIIAAAFPAGLFTYVTDEHPPVHSIDSFGFDLGVSSGLVRHTQQGLDYNG